MGVMAENNWGVLGTNLNWYAFAVAVIKGTTLEVAFEKMQHPEPEKVRLGMTEEDKLDLVRLFDSGVSCTELGEIYGIHLSNAAKIYKDTTGVTPTQARRARKGVQLVCGK